MREKALIAARCTGFDICGCDVIETEDGAQVLEVNGSFGISDEMNKIIGEDVVLRLVERMHERALENKKKNLVYFRKGVYNCFNIRIFPFFDLFFVIETHSRLGIQLEYPRLLVPIKYHINATYILFFIKHIDNAVNNLHCFFGHIFNFTNSMVPPCATLAI